MDIAARLLDILATFNQSFLDLSSLTDLPIKDRVFYKYSQNLKTDLENILAVAEDDIIAKLCHYLGNCKFPRFFTAYPDSPLIQLLTALAETLAESHNSCLKKGDKPWSSLELLMPKLNLESNHQDYPHLGVYEKPTWNLRLKNELKALKEGLSAKGLPTREEALELNPKENQSFNDYTHCIQHLAFYAKNKTLAKEAQIKTLRKKLNHLKRTKDLTSALKKHRQIKKIRRVRFLEEEQKNYLQVERQIALGELKAYGNLLLPCNKTRQILKTHILSTQNDALIPLSVLLQEDNFFHPYEKLSQSTFQLSKTNHEDEQARLHHHSAEALAFHEAKQHLNNLKSENNLLGHLTELCKKLRLYDALEGIGEEKNAGSGTYEAIRKFASYYETLGYQLRKYDEKSILAEGFIYFDLAFNAQSLAFSLDYRVKFGEKCLKGRLNKTSFPQLAERIQLKIEQNKERRKQGKPLHLLSKESLFEEVLDLKEDILSITHQNQHSFKEKEAKYYIPKRLRKEIELLLKLAKDPYTNINATANMQTCIAFRRDALEKAIKGQEVHLVTISSSKQQQAALLQEALQQLNLAETTFRKSLKQPLYTGQDKFFLSLPLLEELDIELKFKQYTDLNAFMELSAEEIKALPLKEVQVQAIIDHLHSIEKLALFIHEYPCDKLAALLEQIQPQLLNRLCKDLSAAKAILSSLEGRKWSLFAKALYQHKNLGLKLVFAYAQEPEHLKEMLGLIPKTQYQALWEEEDADRLGLLHHASGQAASVKMVLDFYPPEKKGIALKKKDRYGNTVLHYAAECPESLDLILAHYPTKEHLRALKAKNNFGYTILHKAAKNPEALKIILSILTAEQALEAIKEEDFSGNTVLIEAISAPESLKIILDLYPPTQVLDAIKAKNNHGHAALYLANQSPESLKILLALYPPEERLKAVQEKTQIDEVTLLHKAAERPEALKIILDLYPQEQRLEAIKAVDFFGDSALHYAAKNPISIQMLLELYPAQKRMAAILSQGSFGNTVFYNAAPNPEALEAILKVLSIEERIKLIQATDQTENTVFYKAAENLEAAKLILESLPWERRLEAIDINIKKVLKEVIFEPELLKSILALYSKEQALGLIKEKDELGHPLLYEAAAYTESLKILLEYYPPEERLTAVQEKDSRGFNTLLHYAAINARSLELILGLYPQKQRLKAIRQKDAYQQTVLHHTANHLESLAIILDLYQELGLNPLEEKDIEERTLLHKICLPESLKVILDLYPPQQRLKALKEKDILGHSCLSEAAKDWDLMEIIFNALEQEERLEAAQEKNQQGKTVLYQSISEPAALKIILDTLNPEQRSKAIKEEKNALYHAIENPESLKIILESLSSKEVLELILERNKTGNTLLHQVARDANLLKIVLNALPKEQRLSALTTLNHSKNTTLFFMSTFTQSIQVALRSLPSFLLMTPSILQYIKNYLPYASHKDFLDSLYGDLFTDLFNQLKADESQIKLPFAALNTGKALFYSDSAAINEQKMTKVRLALEQIQNSIRLHSKLCYHPIDEIHLQILKENGMAQALEAFAQILSPKPVQQPSFQERVGKALRVFF